MKITSLIFLPLALAAPARLDRRANPTVVASAAQATVVGNSLLGVESFKGIPYAQPPVNQLRLKPPQPLTSAIGRVDGTGIPRSCPQFYFSVDKATFPFNLLGDLLNTPLLQAVTFAGEDCLTVNVQRPAGTKPGDKLPVLFWIFGGGFELGATAQYDGTSLVAESVSQGKPVVFVAVNYRLGGFGFMPGKEILADGSSNLGLLDQRLGLQWVADNIADFGGDPEKVTIWGESAGSISVMDQMMMYDGDNSYKGKPLFRGGIMNSGSVAPADPVDCAKGQAVYDRVVEAASCSSASDTLACLRGLPYEKFLTAANTVPGILSHFTVNLSYFPRPDGKVLTKSPDILASTGTYAKVPFIVGDQEDEGTLFSLFTGNITTTDEISQYLLDVFFHHATKDQMDEMVGNYENIWDYGSPFRTGIFNNIFPQFKRIAAILGDMTFTLTRRTWLDTSTRLSPDVPSWSYLSSYDHLTPVMGTFHASDILQVFYGIFPNNAAKTIRGYYFSFVYNLDPNVGNDFDNWPQWSEGQQLMNFNAHSNSLINDDFRKASSDFLINNADSLRV